MRGLAPVQRFDYLGGIGCLASPFAQVDFLVLAALLGNQLHRKDIPAVSVRKLKRQVQGRACKCAVHHATPDNSRGS